MSKPTIADQLHLAGQIEQARIDGKPAPPIIKDGLSYDPLTGIFRWVHDRKRGIKAGAIAGSASGGGYFQIKVWGRSRKAHRVAWFLVHDVWPTGLIDHINGDCGDNRISNLRDVTPSINQLNRRRSRRDSTTGIRGVRYEGGVYIAYGNVAGKRYYLGRSQNKDVAAALRAEFDARVSASIPLTGKWDPNAWTACFKTVEEVPV